MHFNVTHIRYITDRFTFIFGLFLSCTLLLSSSWADEEEPAEGSALDSIEELVDDLEEDKLTDDDLTAAIKAEEAQNPDPESGADEAKPDAEPKPRTKSTSAPEKAKITTSSIDASATTVSAKPTLVRRKPDALLVLKADRIAQVWINGRYRGKVASHKARSFPVKSGRVIVKLKDKKGNMRRFARKIRPKSRVKASVNLNTKRVRSKGRKKALKKNIRKTVKKSVRKSAKKTMRKAVRKVGRKAARKVAK